MINSFPGNVYATPDLDSAIFLDPEGCRLLANVIGEFITEPTTAGPDLNVAALRELQGLLGESKVPISEDASPVILSQELAIHLRLIIEQIFIQSKLPVKYQFNCRDCGRVWLDDPDRIAQREAEQRKAARNQTLIDITSVVSLLEGHRKLLAAIRGYAALTRSHPNNDIRCSRCQGNRLDLRYATFCPCCHELRTEALLLECPGCTYDFRELSSEQLWTTATDALDQFKVRYKQLATSEAGQPLSVRAAKPGQ